MHVLMTTDAVGGVFNHTLTLAGALVERGADVSVAVLGAGPSTDQLAQLEAVRPLAIHQLEGKLEWMPEPWDDLRRAEALLLELEQQRQPDVIHAGSYFCGSIGFAAPVLVVAHSCVCSWWQGVRGCEPPAEWAAYRRMVSQGLAAADAVVAPSATMLAALRSHYGALPQRARVIFNGAELDSRTATKESFVLAAGRMWDAAKNLEALTAVAEVLPQPVLIAGELPPPPADGATAESPARGARLLGRLPADELACLRRRALVFAAPARYEPFGLSILEAAGDRCALVLGDIPSLRELWAGCAEFVAPEDHERLLATLRTLLDDPTRAQRLAQRARRRAEQLSPAAMADAYGGLYLEMTRDTTVMTCAS